MSAAERAQAKLVVRSEQTSERCEQTSKRTSEWPSTYIWVLDGSGPQCSVDHGPTDGPVVGLIVDPVVGLRFDPAIGPTEASEELRRNSFSRSSVSVTEERLLKVAEVRRDRDFFAVTIRVMAASGEVEEEDEEETWWCAWTPG